ncbi:Ribokinase [Candidatus Lokiarchaeum ossiferum]|uniref:Ribokinase n=1 Tax=Candidatus Lokiarchaeum ossiferum TaxID=2951803 RepID=A0ABY6HR95_9ARCH|nr:Ribokinase [Candidatus Lokiarchaeum sp. B-35]
MNETNNFSQKIVIIGDVILDAISSPFPIKKEMLLNESETLVDSIKYQRGGCAGNFASVYKSVFPSSDIHLVSRIGMNPFGDFLINEFQSQNINCYFNQDLTCPTQTSLAITYSNGKRHFITSLGGLAKFNIDDVPKDILIDAHHVAYRGIWFSEKLLLQAEKLLIWLKENTSASISLDLGFDPFWNLPNVYKEETISKIRRKSLLNILKYVDILFGNESEICTLTENYILESAVDELISKGAKLIVVHQGEKGSSIYQLNSAKNEVKVKKRNFPALPVEIVNPVGSGDTFDSIIIGYLLKGISIENAVKYATKGASYSISNLPGSSITRNIIES